MKGTNSITINGRSYDAITGMPLPQKAIPAAPLHTQTPQKQTPLPVIHPEAVKKVQALAAPKIMQDVAGRPSLQSPTKITHPSATQVHQQTQRSRTLHPAARKRPTAQHNVTTAAAKRSPTISRFAPEPAPTITSAKPEADRPTPIHPAVARAISGMAAQRSMAEPERPQTSKELKEALIKERLAEVEQANTNKQSTQRRFFARQPKLTAILTSTLAVLLLGGYFTYINLPNISMRVAATRAGVAANFPGYHPDGYSFAGPITYAPGEVAIQFKSNTNNNNFTIKEKNSSWDSQAVLDNYVAKQTDTYLTYQEGGLTIYSFGNKAAWVNGGLLYSVEGSASLSSEQLIRLATSM